MPTPLRPPQSDDYRAMLLAAGPGVFAGAVGLLVMGYGPPESGPAGLLWMYPLVLLASIPAVPFVALALVHWLPSRTPLRPRGVLSFVPVLLASAWHLLFAEVLLRIDGGEGLAARAWGAIACAAVPALVVTVLAWAAYLRVRGPRPQPRERLGRS